jgi:hypothetical protein
MGIKRCWIGSAIAAAESVGLPGQDVHELSRLLGRLLQGRDCDFPMPPVENPAIDGFLIRRPNDPDTRMAVFSATECRHLAGLLESLMDRSPTFVQLRRPADDPAEWDAHVREMIRRFLKLKDLFPPCTHMVTFIG